MARREIWIFLFLLGVVVFNWPFLTIFDDSLPRYLFGCWALFIALAAAAITYFGKDKSP